jgi:hypothetical protein
MANMISVPARHQIDPKKSPIYLRLQTQIPPNPRGLVILQQGGFVIVIRQTGDVSHFLKFSLLTDAFSIANTVLLIHVKNGLPLRQQNTPAHL